MPFREDIDVTSYLAKLGIEDHGLHSAVIRVDGVDASQPYKAGDGPLVASTSTELVLGPQVIWDVNGYYRWFGVPWPYRNVTRHELRVRALEHFATHGQTEWATYALMLLLRDTPARREYWFQPLGSPYLDRYYSDELKGMAAEVAAKLNEAGDEVTAREVLASWGLEITEDPDVGEREPVTEEELARLAEEHPDAVLSEVSATQTWDWSFYIQTAPVIDLDALRTWQELLISELNDLTNGFPGGVLEGIAVGVAGGQEWEWNVEAVDGNMVFLVNSDILPTSDMAHAAVEWMMHPDQRNLFRLRDAQRGTDEME